MNKRKPRNRQHKTRRLSNPNFLTCSYSYFKTNQNQPLNKKKFQPSKFDPSNHQQTRLYKNVTIYPNELKKSYNMFRNRKQSNNHHSQTAKSHPKSEKMYTSTHQGKHQEKVQKNLKKTRKADNIEIVPIKTQPKSYDSIGSSNHNSKSFSKFQLNMESITRKSNITCHFCCCKGHTSLECMLRGKNNMLNVVWVPKPHKN